MTGLSIGINTPSLIAQGHYAQAGRAVASSLEKLATGSRINRGADDPAGLISSEELRAAMAALDAESRAMERTDAVANVADGALTEVSSLLSDANAAAVATANTAGMSDAEREAYQMEIDSALQSVDRIAATTTFNGQRLFSGDMTLSAGGTSVTVASVATGDLGQVTINGSDYRLSDAKTGGDLDASAGAAQGAQQTIGAAISQVATLRGQIGAFQKNTIGPQLRSSATAFQNTAAANSIIRDTDYAAETANLTRGRILQASTLSVLAMANAAPRSVLEMLA